MCDGSEKRAEAAEPSLVVKGEEGAREGVLSRRRVLLMGAGMAGGAVMGLWSCQNGGGAEKAGSGAKGLTSGPATSMAAATKAGGTTAEGAGVATGPATRAETQAASGPATARAATPELGVEVFPDEKGVAIAKISDAPVIVVPRSNWTTAGPNLKQIEVMNGVHRITVHHTAGAIQTDAWKPTAGELESIREFHSGTSPADRAWADIAYHFAVDRAGRVWQARPLAYQGAHVKGENAHNMGIVLLGNFEVQSPSAAQLTALGAFIGFVRRIYDVPLGQVFTHGELGMTSCPGKQLQAYMDRTRKGWARITAT